MKIRHTKEGIQLFDRKTGWNVLIEEYIPKKLSLSPANVSIAITGKCNLSCRHCFVEKKDKELSLDTLVKWLKELDELGCLGVGFGGGEPLLHSKIVELCEFVHKKTSMACTLTSNGILLDEKMIKALEKNVDFCRISIDGVGKTYEKIRGIPFDFIMSRIHYVSKRIKVGINYLVNDYTCYQLDKAIEIFKKENIKEILLIPEVSKNGEIVVEQSCLNYFKSWVGKYQGDIPLRVSELGAQLIDNSVYIPGDVGYRSYLHIDCYGNLKKNSFSTQGIKILDSLKNSIELFYGEKNENLEYL